MGLLHLLFGCYGTSKLHLTVRTNHQVLSQHLVSPGHHTELKPKDKPQPFWQELNSYPSLGLTPLPALNIPSSQGLAQPQVASQLQAPLQISSLVSLHSQTAWPCLISLPGPCPLPVRCLPLAACRCQLINLFF